ncbi:unnamed protein product [Vitrella brassicaformis CCMP3155]|uniref:Uncharacterized protein n=1 Tax=Vitrella brassicaformis (strain CCMP3155) TaxID=1169540 RepID=A0A0G4EBW7_VITBC|nr:unnamed protein product [Vitrella brassicaformis CCMP3155]|eukprot:CEL92800.1 unnamed protein product [Vitrella brassicaformis CCMP3155]
MATRRDTTRPSPAAPGQLWRTTADGLSRDDFRRISIPREANASKSKLELFYELYFYGHNLFDFANGQMPRAGKPGYADYQAIQACSRAKDVRRRVRGAHNQTCRCHYCDGTVDPQYLTTLQCGSGLLWHSGPAF